MQDVLQQFSFSGRVERCEPFGNGHINRTYHVLCSGGEYILQRISRAAFQNPPALMQNIEAVTRYMAAQPGPLQSLHLVGTKQGLTYCVDHAGEYWRAYDYIRGGVCLQAPRSTEDVYQAALAFGQFQMALAGFPAATLHETIPRFHDTCDRLRQLRQSAEKDPLGRAEGVKQELAFIFSREHELGELCRLRDDGTLPVRVTHNDTKLNNVLLDAQSGKALCVLDLDTVMPGLSAYDFGDAVRFGASTAAEDERDLAKVSLDLRLYEAILRGYLDACGSALDAREIEVLPLGAKIITAETGIRFLKDYLDGDVYFTIHRPEQNLDRARTQLKLVADMEEKWEDMQRVLRAVVSSCGQQGMAASWDTAFHGISVSYTRGVVHVRTDEALMRYLAEPGRGAQALAAHILASYEVRIGCALSISERSLAVEILVHAYCDALLLHVGQLAAALPGALGAHLQQAAERLQAHTDVIDMGERALDANRWLFDQLEPFYPALCAVLGDRA